VFVQNFAPGWLDRLEILGRAAAATAAAASGPVRKIVCER
jgi:hypothetical protein